MPTVVSEQFSNLLTVGLREVFYVTAADAAEDSRIPMLFRQDTSTKSNEEYLGIGATSKWEAYTGDIHYKTFSELYKTTLTHVEYADGIAIERKLIDDEKYNVMTDRTRLLAESAVYTREDHAASVFNNAFSDSYAGGDSEPLCDDSHPASPTNATTQDNDYTYTLTYDNVVTCRRLMREFKDDRGKLITGIRPDTLLVPAELEETAWAIWKTGNKVDIADYHANFVGTFLDRVIVWDHLTDANAWFLIDGRRAKKHLLWVDRVPLEFAVDPTSDYNLEYKYRGYMRYSYGWSDWRWVLGNNPS